ncbi:hypothetical protein [Cycloclasticus pugetii]|uniref:hypothetical protein n=1 Tax=Cycloclasticus pugetii TaxID=34068 RepID=UPI000361942D|nr:hypothetical protein [Cycloclasticus pugetii]
MPNETIKFADIHYELIAQHTTNPLMITQIIDVYNSSILLSASPCVKTQELAQALEVLDAVERYA